jgi:hypothetical protein
VEEYIVFRLCYALCRIARVLQSHRRFHYAIRLTVKHLGLAVPMRSEVYVGFRNDSSRLAEFLATFAPLMDDPALPPPQRWTRRTVTALLGISRFWENLEEGDTKERQRLARALAGPDYWETFRTDSLTLCSAMTALEAARLVESRPLPRTDWEFGTGQFRYKDEWNDLEGQSWKLLRAFVTKDLALTHQEVCDWCCGDGEPGSGLSDRHYAYVSELNKKLCRIWKLKDKPIRPIRGLEAYLLYPPS